MLFTHLSPARFDSVEAVTMLRVNEHGLQRHGVSFFPE